MSQRFQWNYPTTVWGGPGRAADLHQACSQAGIQHPLLVTDSGLASHPMIQQALDRLKTFAPTTRCFSNVKSNPTAQSVTEGLAAYHSGNHDGVVAIGGGSALDAGKAIAFMAGQTRPIWDFEDIGDWWKRADPKGIAPSVAIPTTAGTGSEVGRAAVITHDSTHEKKIIFHPKMLPAVAILDPELTVGLPPSLTAFSGIDAFSHCFEAFFSPGFHPLADGIALQGMRIVQQALPIATTHGSDLNARSQMLAAASMGAAAFQKGLGAVHGLAHAIGALYDTHHGLTVGVLLPYVLAYNASHIPQQIATLNSTLGLPDPSASTLLRWLVDFRKTIGIPHTLTDLKLDSSQTERLSQLAFADPSTGGNPAPIDAAAYATVFEKALHGSLSVK